MLNYKKSALQEKIKRACPNGVDVYYDNVGGQTSDWVLELMNRKGRVPICGQIANYNKDIEYKKMVSPEGIAPAIREKLESLEVNRGRFLVLNYEQRYDEGMVNMKKWLQEGKVKAVETVTFGFNPASAFVSMMKGGNVGKAIVDLTQEPASSSSKSQILVNRAAPENVGLDYEAGWAMAIGLLVGMNIALRRL